MTKKRLLTLMLKCILIGCTPSLFANEKEIPAFLQEYIDDQRIIGASIGLIENGKISTFSYGKTSINSTDDDVTENTLFEIGSITKVFTTLGLMQLVTNGEMHLDDPIELYLPDVKVPEKNGIKITLRHLATHQSGLPSIPTNFHPKNPTNPFHDYSLKDLYEFLNDYELVNTPGEKFEYSNVGMGLLGNILCLKTGKSYDQLILDMINMQNTSIYIKPDANFARGHHLNQIVDHWDFTQAIVAAGGLRSNVHDLTQFLLVNLKVLNSPLTASLAECHKPQCTANSETQFGLGWILSSSIIWHNGGTGGFCSFLGFNPETQKGVVILSNSTDRWPEELGFKLLK